MQRLAAQRGGALQPQRGLLAGLVAFLTFDALAKSFPNTCSSAARSILRWSNARAGGRSAGCHSASAASSPALTARLLRRTPAKAMLTVWPLGSRPGSPNAATCSKLTRLTPVSSSSSRKAACLSGSFSSTNPPGSAHFPLKGPCARLINSTSISSRGLRNTTISAVTAGRGYL